MLNTNIAPWPAFSQEEIDATAEVLRSGKVNQWTGEHVKAFEREFADYIGTKYAVALANGTVALDLIFRAYRYNHIDGEEVIVTSRTFIATISSIVNEGLRPVFVDVDPDTGNIDPKEIIKAITPNTRYIMCVHLAGHPCDMDEIMRIADTHGLVVIEDCAQAHGGVYKGRKLGSIGHAAAWSFCQDKIMTTGGEGGMVTTNSEHIWQDIWEFKDHGKSFGKMIDPVMQSGFRWVHDSFGSNHRMTEMQAAIGRIQLKKMQTWTHYRNANAGMLDYIASHYSAIREIPQLSVDCVHAKYKHYMYVDPNGLKEGWTRNRIINELNEQGVPCYAGTCSEVYLETAFINSGFPPRSRLPNARMLGETSLMFLVHPNITTYQLGHCMTKLATVLSAASKIVDDRQ